MDKQEFNLSDGVVTATVTADSGNKRLTIRFDVRDGNEPKPVLDMDKYRNAVAHQTALRTLLQNISNDADVDMPSMDNSGHIIMSATFAQPAEVEQAVALLRAHILQPPAFHAQDAAENQPSPLETLGEQFRTHPQDIPDVAPDILIDEASTTHNYLLRILNAENKAEQDHSLTVWKLNNTASGMNAAVFPTDTSAISGKSFAQDTPKLVAIRITPGIDSNDARTTLYNNTREIERRLLTRGVLLTSAEVYRGEDNSGHHDTGVILVKAEKNIQDSLDRINAVISSVRQDQDVIAMKYGSRFRGADHHHRSKVTTIALRPAPDSLEATLESNIRSAASAGVIKITGTPEEVDAWVKSMAAELRYGQHRPGRPGTGGGRE